MIIIYPDMTQITERRGTAMYPRQTDVGNVFLDQFPFSSSALLSALVRYTTTCT